LDILGIITTLSFPQEEAHVANGTLILEGLESCLEQVGQLLLPRFEVMRRNRLVLERRCLSESNEGQCKEDDAPAKSPSRGKSFFGGLFGGN